jgi:hypothetical protein
MPGMGRRDFNRSKPEVREVIVAAWRRGSLLPRAIFETLIPEKTIEVKSQSARLSTGYKR